MFQIQKITPTRGFQVCAECKHLKEEQTTQLFEVSTNGDCQECGGPTYICLKHLTKELISEGIGVWA